MTGNTDPGNFAQIKAMMQQAADMALQEHEAKFRIAIQEFAAKMNPPAEQKSDTTAVVLKWVAGIIGTVSAVCITGGGIWVISSITDMQQTLVRIDERQKAQVETKDAQNNQLADHERRIIKLERFHSQQGGI